jgi:Tfp pilus assembly protein PilO
MKLGFLRKLPKDKLQKVVLVCIVTLCATVVVVHFYVIANWNVFRDAKNRIAIVNDQIQQAESAARQAAQDTAYRGQLNSFVETQQAAMIAGDPFAWVVREISLLVEKHPVHIDGLHPGGRLESSEKSKYQTYTSRIEITGTYDQIGVFVRDLENKFPTGEVRSLTVSGSAEDQGRHQAAIDLVLRSRPERQAKTPEAKKTS